MQGATDTSPLSGKEARVLRGTILRLALIYLTLWFEHEKLRVFGARAAYGESVVALCATVWDYWKCAARPTIIFGAPAIDPVRIAGPGLLSR